MEILNLITTHWMSISAVVLAIFTGALAGWATNDWALNRLFGKTGPIIKGKKELAENIGEAMSASIITEQVVKDTVSSSRFRNAFGIFIENFYNTVASNTKPDVRFSDLSQSNELINSFYSETVNNEHIDAICKNIASDIEAASLRSILSDECIFSIKEKTIDKFFQITVSHDLGENAGELVYIASKDKRTVDIIGERTADAICENISSICRGLPGLMQNELRNETKGLVTKLLNILEADKMFLQFLENAKTDIQNGLSNKNEADVNALILNRASEFLNTAEGKSLISNVYAVFSASLKKINMKLDDIIDVDEFIRNITKMLNEEHSELLEIITIWVNNNKRDIETLINESIRKYVKNTDQEVSFRKSFYEWISKSDIAGNLHIVSKIVSILNTEMTPEEVRRLILLEVHRLKNLSLGNFIEMLENNGMMSDDIARQMLEKQLHNMRNNNITFVSKADLLKVLAYFDKFTAGDIMRKAEDFLLSMINKDYFIGYITKQVNKGIDSLKMMRVAELPFTRKEFTSVCEKFANNSNEHKPKLQKVIDEIINTTKAGDIIPDTHAILKKKINNTVAQEMRELSNRPLRKIIGYFEKNLSAITGYLYKKVLEILPSKSTQTISLFVAQTLLEKPDEEIISVARTVMGGKELFKLKVFGAILGAIFSLVLSAGIWLYSGTPVLDTTSFAVGVISVVVFMAIGYVTNVLALYMIFRPYKKWLIFEGVVPRNKASFANGMGKLIEKEIFSKQSVDKYTSTLINDMDDYVSAEMIANLISDNKEILAQELLKMVDLEKIMADIQKHIESLGFSDIVHTEKIPFYLKKIETYLLEYDYLPYIKSLTTDNHNKLNVYTDEQTLGKLHEKMVTIISEQLSELAEEVTNANLTRTLANELYQQHKNGKLSELLPDITGTLITDTREYFTKKALDSLTEFVKTYINKEFADTNTLKNTFEGKIFVFLREQMDNLSDILIEKAHKFIKNDAGDKIIEYLRSEHWILFPLANNTFKVEENIRGICGSIDTKSFLNKRKYEITELINNLVNDKFSDKTLRDFGIRQRPDFNDKLMQHVSSLEVKNTIGNVLGATLNYTTSTMELQSVLNALGFSNIDAIMRVVNNSVKNFEQSVGEKIKLHSAETLLLAGDYTAQILNSYYNTLTMSDVFALTDSTCKDFEMNLKKHLRNGLLESVIFESYERCSRDLFALRINDICDLAFLNDSIYSFILKTYDGKRESIKIGLTAYISDMARNVDKIVPQNFLDCINYIARENLITVVNQDTEAWLDVLQIAQTVEDRINILDSKIIKEDIFDVIAKKHFGYLKAWGIAGGIYGLVYFQYIAVVATMLWYAGVFVNNTGRRLINRKSVKPQEIAN